MLPAILVFSQEGIHAKEFPSLAYDRTEVRTIHSDISGLDYELWISLPKSYELRESGVYPVIYATDPYRGFSIIKEFTDLLSQPVAYIDEVIIVGIGYGGVEPDAVVNWALGRVRDYSPVQDPDLEDLYKSRLSSGGKTNIDVQTGGAPEFLNFIENELIPFIERNYRADSRNRMLTGYSLGGLFGMYALFHKPELFAKYFIGSPSIHFGDEITFEYEHSYASQNPDLKAEVFLSAGALEERTSENVLRMEELLRSHKYPNLTVHAVIFEEETHASCFPGALSRSLIELLGN